MTLSEADVRQAIAKTVLNIDAMTVSAQSDFDDIGIDSLDHSSIDRKSVV